MTALLLALGLGSASAAEPSDQALIYYNARMALREGQPAEAIELWLLRNAVEDHTDRISPYDEDFRSITWAALGDLGICQDGAEVDEGGVGLWPVAFHNWFVRNMGRRISSTPRPFAAFEAGRQQRRIALGDVLSPEELRAAQLKPGRCARPRLLMLSLGESPLSKLSDQHVVADMLLYLLNRAESTLADDRVRGRSVIAARRFDLHLELMAIARREAQQAASEKARLGRAVGLSRPSVEAMNEEAPAYSFSEDSVPAQILRDSATWPASEWMALSPDRRLFLFDHAREAGVDSQALDRVALGVIDGLVAQGEGEQVDAWIARLSGTDVGPDAREAVWEGDRGARLLTLDRESGFQERGVIALYRGVDQLQRGDLPGALRSLAFALAESGNSKAADDTRRLSLRWLSYTAAQFSSTSELLVTLKELVPALDYAIILEDLMGRAALRADRESFVGGLATRPWGSGGRAALDRRVALLEPLSRGDLAGFVAKTRAGLVDSPSETLRFLDQLVEQLEHEQADVRAAHVLTLRRVADLVLPLTEPNADGSTGRQGRAATDLEQRIQAIEEGQQGLTDDATDLQRARSLSPGGEVFAGSVRLAPVDPLPWPFHASPVAAPTVFAPIDLTPEEWRDASGELVFGWSIGG
jgi:hypothetical protein